MRRSAVSLVLIIMLLAALFACGGSSSKPASVSTVVLAPATVSLTKGDVQQMTATAQDAKGNRVAGATITYQSSNPAVATVSTAGLVCAGTWDAAFIVCTPGTSGSANISATSSGVTSNAVPVAVHERIDSVQVSPSIGVSNCISQTKTQNFSAHAFSKGVDITSGVGTFTWTSSDLSVVTLDNTVSGLNPNEVQATAKGPGTAVVFAVIAGISSVPTIFTTCPVQSISLHVQDSADVSLSLAPGASKQLIADALDTTGAALSEVAFTFNSSQPAVATAASGNVVAVAAGTTNVVASCTPPACNAGLYPIFSNVVTAAVSGTSATTVYTTSSKFAASDAKSLTPIDISTNTPGAAITLPSIPNSLAFNNTGAKAYLGSPDGLMIFDVATNAVSQIAAAKGKVLAVSPNAVKVIVSDTTAGKVYVFDQTTSAVETFTVPAGTAADFAVDSSKAFIVSGSTLFVYAPNTTLRSIALAGAANDVSVLASGPFAYFGGGAASAITARAVCDNSLADTVVAAASPLLLKTLPNASQVVAVDSSALDAITPTASAAGCPPSLSDALVAHNFGQGAFAPRQLIVASDSSKVFVTSNLPTILEYDVAGATTTTLALAGGASESFTGGVTLDGKLLYVGASDNTIHKVDVVAGADAQQIPVTFVPDLVAVRPK